jgi:hypothetical protein
LTTLRGEQREVCQEIVIRFEFIALFQFVIHGEEIERF